MSEVMECDECGVIHDEENEVMTIKDERVRG